MNILRFAKNWALPLAMMAGAALYFIADSLPLSHAARHACVTAVSLAQPALIFAMLFITFCKVDFRDALHLRRWHLWGLLMQSSVFCLLAAGTLALGEQSRVIAEGAMVCMICPTATAAAVVTSKLGGSAAQLTTYTVLVNLTTALVVSAVIPLIHPQPGVTFATDFTLIIVKIMPLLFLPILAAMAARRWWPSIPALLKRHPDTAFYLWCIALALAIAVTARSVVTSDYPFASEAGIAGASLLACAAQYAFGRWIGRADRVSRITAAQSLGQKNTVFAIWMGYTFLDPITSIAGGFYSVWHNIYNSWQLYKARVTANTSQT